MIRDCCGGLRYVDAGEYACCCGVRAEEYGSWLYRMEREGLLMVWDEVEHQILCVVAGISCLYRVANHIL